MNAPIFKEQESAALPTELTTQNLTKRIITITKKYVQIICARKENGIYRL